MRLVKLDESLIGKKLGTDLRTLDGKRLANSGAELSERLIERLKNYGMDRIYVEDENLDITLQETLSEEKRANILSKLNNIYEKISKQNTFDEFELGKLIRSDILPEISKDPVSLPIGKTAKGYDLTQHSLNVCLLSISTGLQMDLGMDKIDILAKAALLHDIGKIVKSTKKEMGHEQIGYEFLKAKTNSVIVYNLVRFHHETIDGNGPQKLSFENQNEFIKILSLCNSYENMLNQDQLVPTECFEKIQSLANTKFDLTTFEAFRKSIYLYPIGIPVKLSNGEEAIVCRQNKAFPLRPFVRSKSAEYNLMENLTLFITDAVI